VRGVVGVVVVVVKDRMPKAFGVRMGISTWVVINRNIDGDGIYNFMVAD